MHFLIISTAPLALISAVPSLAASEEPTFPQTAVPVFQAKTDSVEGHRYQCYREPVTVKTKSGRILVGVHAGNRLSWPERSGQDLAIRYSDDQGKTWSPIIVAAEHKNFSCQSHGLVYDEINNRLHFLYVTYNWDYSSIKGRGYKATAPLYLKMHEAGTPAMSAYSVYSDDEGKTWSKPKDLTSMVGGDAHFGASEGRQLKASKHKGRLVIAGGNNRLMDPKGKVINKDIGVWLSDDQGTTWKFSEISTPAIEAAKGMNMSCEARISELQDGTLVYNARISSASKGRLNAISKDGGTSWTDIKLNSVLSSAKSNGCTITLKDKIGNATNTLWFSVPVGKLNNCTLFKSIDAGKTWKNLSAVVSGCHVKYTAMIQLDHDTVGLFYETSHYKDILFKTLSISELNK